MPADFTSLEGEVSQLTSVVDSSVALMDGFQSHLDAAIAADNLSDNSNVARFSAEFATQKTRLADAVARNTPAAPDSGSGETGGSEPA